MKRLRSTKWRKNLRLLKKGDLVHPETEPNRVGVVTCRYPGPNLIAVRFSNGDVINYQSWALVRSDNILDRLVNGG